MNSLSQFLPDPHQKQLDATISFIHYLKPTPGQGILLLKMEGLSLLPFVMLNGWGVSSLDDLKLDISFCWEELQFHGEQRNSQMCHMLLLKLNIEPWIPL